MFTRQMKKNPAALVLLLALAAPAAPLMAEPHSHMPPRMPARIEAQHAPRGYDRFEPQGLQRPHAFDHDYFSHNFQAHRVYHIGPYHAPPHFAYRRWQYGQILPPAFWAPPYILGDFWLFGLDVPPVGYEWVRYGPDAILVDTSNGMIGQVVYGSFL